MRAILDTNILIALTDPDEPTPELDRYESVEVSIVTWVELSTGLHAARTLEIYKRRHRSLATLRGLLGSGIPFDEQCQSAFETILETSVESGAQASSNRMDKMIAATALAHDLVLVTRNPDDFKHLAGLIHIAEA